MSYKRRFKGINATFYRSYLITLGLCFGVLGLFLSLAWVQANPDATPIGLMIAAIAFGLGGLILISLGFVGSSKRMQAWAESASKHEASLLMMALAYPVYLLIRPFFEPRR
jgi:hypothetical protein